MKAIGRTRLRERPMTAGLPMSLLALGPLTFAHAIGTTLAGALALSDVVAISRGTVFDSRSGRFRAG